jgi:cell division protein FtsW (lipid II flippase)
MLALLAALAIVWVLWQPQTTVRDDALPALAVVLAALGLAMVARLSPPLAQRQQLWVLFSLVLCIAAGPAFTHFRRFAAYKYLWVIASLVLFALLLAFGEEVNGARLWIRFGPIQYEPIELIKLFIVFFLAAYLAETADVIGSAPPWSLRANLKYLGPLFIGWGASMAILVVQRDLGMATLLLATFATMLFVATRRADIVVFGALFFILGAFWAGVIRSRIRSAPAINPHRRITRSRPAVCWAADTGSAIPNSFRTLQPIMFMPLSRRSSA